MDIIRQFIDAPYGLSLYKGVPSCLKDTVLENSCTYNQIFDGATSCTAGSSNSGQTLKASAVILAGVALLTFFA